LTNKNPFSSLYKNHKLPALTQQSQFNFQQIFSKTHNHLLLNQFYENYAEAKKLLLKISANKSVFL